MDTRRITGVSVVVPTMNEERSIVSLLDALAGQTLRPAEIVVADGGSTDRTRELVREFAARSRIPVVLLEGGRGLPGRNRNLGLARASREWVACVDAGTLPRADWLERLVAAAERDPDARVVYGQYEPLTDDFFTRCSAVVYLPPPGEVVRSTASLLMHRTAWEAAGPFREDLRSAEDLLFFRALDAARVPAAYARDAFVEWELKRTASDTFRKFTSYSRNNLRAGLAREWQYGVARFYAVLLAAAVAGLLFRPALLAVPLLFAARAARRAWRWHPRAAALFNVPRLLMVTWLNLVIDAATFYGTFQWLVHDRAGVPEEKDGG
ncbi:MAG TPA: glycosyltransferase [Pyrinomonadaceae bacterium]|jgi:glycosyltransferase involved in cell wall biosynthesis|nr:glycosyltransferase [Pyrinomonadaceae bacterium]